MMKNTYYFDWATIGESSNNGAYALRGGQRTSRVPHLLGEVLTATSSEIGCDVDRLVLTDSTTQGMDLALDGLLSHRPEIMVITDCAHPTTRGSASRFVERLNKLGLASGTLATVETSSLRVSRSPEQWAESFCKRLTGVIGQRRAVLLLEHVDCMYGVRAPLNVVCQLLSSRFPGVSLVIDGAQASGLFRWKVPSDVWYASGYHKYFDGPAGTGFLVCPQNALEILPQWAWSRTMAGFSSKGEQTPTEDPVRWTTCLTAIQRISSLNPNEREKSIEKMHDILRDELALSPITWSSPTDSQLTSSIIALTLPAEVAASQIVEQLRSKGFVLKATSTGIRVSLHNTLPSRAVIALARAIKDCLS